MIAYFCDVDLQEFDSYLSFSTRRLNTGTSSDILPLLHLIFQGRDIVFFVFHA